MRRRSGIQGSGLIKTCFLGAIHILGKLRIILQNKACKSVQQQFWRVLRPNKPTSICRDIGRIRRIIYFVDGHNLTQALYVQRVKCASSQFTVQQLSALWTGRRFNLPIYSQWVNFRINSSQLQRSQVHILVTNEGSRDQIRRIIFYLNMRITNNVLLRFKHF